jgi:hypothetical protein
MAYGGKSLEGVRDGLRGFGELDRLLRGELTGVSNLRAGGLEISPGRLAACIVILGMVYGICMGTFALFRVESPSLHQVVASMIKVPLLFFLTLLVTLPSLYVFNALVGSRLTLSMVVRLLIASLGVMVAVLASLGPIVAFFSVSTTSYPFMVLFNVLVFGVSGGLGLMFLLQTLHRLSVAGSQGGSSAGTGPAEPATEPAEPPAPAGPLDPLENRVLSGHVKTVFRLWVIVFGLVGAQMGWVLRPFIGNPALPFTWFRGRESNFFQAVFQTLGRLLSS